MAELPLEIISDILFRVPVKPLICFRCVSKQWYILIHSPHFVKTHLKRSLQNRTNLTLILAEKINPYQNTINLHSLQLDSPNDSPIPFDNDFSDSSVLDSCDGLILLISRKRSALVLFNPSTRQYRDVLEIYVRGAYGLLYDSVNDDYKVIGVDNNDAWSNPQARIYSLKLNLWRKIGSFPFCPYRIEDNKWGALVNGVMHLLVSHNFYYLSRSTECIAAFDVAKEIFYLVPKPDVVEKEDVYVAFDVADVSGCLCLIGSYKDRIDVWVMKVYGVKESWTKLFSIPSPDIHYSLVSLMDYSKNGDEVLLRLHDRELIWYDLEGKKIKNVEVPHWPNMHVREVCVESLVPLNGYKERKKWSMSNTQRALLFVRGIFFGAMRMLQDNEKTNAGHIEWVSEFEGV